MRLSLVCVLFDPAIPTSFFNFIQLFLYLYMYIVLDNYVFAHSNPANYVVVFGQ